MVSSALVSFFSRRLVLVVFAVIVLAAAWIFVHGGDAKRHSERRHGDSLDEDGREIAKRCVSPTDDELESYLRIIQEVVSAYSNCQVEAMFEHVRQLPSKTYQLKGEDHLKLERPINQVWRDDWVLDKGVKEFASVEEFDRQMGKSLAVAKLYGGFMVASGITGDEILVTIDCLALKRLQAYRDKFERDGMADYLQVAERLLLDWIGQIESEKGFAHTYVRAQKSRLRYFVETGELSEEKLVAYVRDYIRPLQDFCGYTPKWLDKDFPVFGIREKKRCEN